MERKRESVRTELELPIKIGSDLEGQVFNLSETGLNFTLERALKPSESCLKVKLSDGKILGANFQIAREKCLSEQNKYNYGVYFTGLKDGEIEMLRTVIIKNEIEDVVKKISDKNIQMEVTDFFTNEVKQFLRYLDGLQKSIYLWDLEKQNDADTSSHNLVGRGNKILDRIGDRRIANAIKKKFRKIVSVLPYKSPLMDQGLNKPYGYPGDFDVIEKIYNNKPLSDGVGKCFDLIFLENPYSRAVRSRKDKMKELLKKFIENFNSQKINIMNLGCGPCREIRELFIDDNFTTDKNIFFSLVDQDKAALGFTEKTVGGKFKNIKFNFLQEDVVIFPESHACKSLGKQDLIYTIGLADYLPDRIFKKVIRDYFNLLVEGGQLIIAHKDRDKDPHAPVFPDWFCDWHFIVRNEEYFTNIIKELNFKNMSIERYIESTGKIIFLCLKKI